MFYGFAAAWLILVLYVLSLLSKGRKLQSEIDTLKRMMQDRGNK
jgi:CcmD family protein